MSDQLTADASHDLEPIYLQLLAVPAADPRETWRLCADNPRYREELWRAAARLLRERRLPPAGVDDVAQEALLILARRLQTRPTLGFDASRGPECLLPWLRAVVRSHCQQALRGQPRRRARELNEKWAMPAPPDPWRAELAEAIQSLDESSRNLVEAYRNFGAIEAVARQLGLSVSTARRRLQKALDRLRRLCGPSAASSGRLFATATIREKW